jgi:trans-aconitate 2-methyltransferase
MEWKADDYSRQSSLQEAMAGQILSLLELSGAERVLDVGCGDGKITARIAERVPRGSVLGVDPSRDMIAFASRHFSLSAGTNLRFEVGDAAHLPYQHEFDLVVSFNALHWVPDQESALRSIRAALRPEGRAILRFVPHGERKSLEDVIEDVRGSRTWSDAFHGFQRPYMHLAVEEYRALAQRSGFRVDDVRVRDEAWDFGTRDRFTAFCRATLVAWTSRLPEDRRDRFIDEVLDLYRLAAMERPEEANTFKFYQMDAALTMPRDPAGDLPSDAA